MRELKFRAWDKEQNRLFDVYGFDEEHVYENTLDDYTHSVHPRSVCDILQYTGIKDKNNKEIYEGYIYHQGDRNILYVVVWHDSGLRGKQVGSSSYAGIEYWKDRIEIVGNIYENE